ncbi:MAG: hypothetical protein JNL50_02205 [Phycisphaerae bacterium]|nr:hypothetical protein [Phycisphaerae bacterium]
MAGTHEYFTDREFGPRAPTHHEISETTWRGLTTLVRRSISKGNFGNTFPDGCPDSPSTCCGTDANALNQTLQAEVPSWPGWDTVPDVATACDFLEFCHRYMALASISSHHGFYKHDHFRFDVAAGQEEFRADVNLLLQRNGIALRMTDEGLMQRILDDPTGEAVRRAVFQTCDDVLDRLLGEARTKFMSPDPCIRQEALERAWDAWERLKTVKDQDKKRGSTLLLDACSAEPRMRAVLEAEAKALTEIGNDFRIRHSETSKPEIVDAEHVDFVFQRMFAMLLLILRKNGMLA